MPEEKKSGISIDAADIPREALDGWLIQDGPRLSETAAVPVGGRIRVRSPLE